MSSSERIAAAAEHGMSVEEFDDLQAWLRHGRIGTGRGYKAEVERAKVMSPAHHETADPPKAGQ